MQEHPALRRQKVVDGLVERQEQTNHTCIADRLLDLSVILLFFIICFIFEKVVRTIAITNCEVFLFN